MARSRWSGRRPSRQRSRQSRRCSLRSCWSSTTTRLTGHPRDVAVAWTIDSHGLAIAPESLEQHEPRDDVAVTRWRLRGDDALGQSVRDAVERFICQLIRVDSVTSIEVGDEPAPHLEYVSPRDSIPSSSHSSRRENASCVSARFSRKTSGAATEERLSVCVTQTVYPVKKRLLIEIGSCCRRASARVVDATSAPDGRRHVGDAAVLSS